MEKLKSLKPKTYKTPSTKRTRFSNSKWERTRQYALKLRRQEAAEIDVALCEHCAMEGKNYRLQAVECHHKIPRRERPDLIYTLSNLQFLCRPHHTLRTHLELAEKYPNRWVVTGPPGAGKTTLVQQRATPDAMVWDADEVAANLNMGAYPRSPGDQRRLSELRRQFLDRAFLTTKPVWVILRWPTTAYRIAIKLGAQVIELQGGFQSERAKVI